jgi:hypothetical protein|eukprot:SAG25_NODE_2197_length_1851_cov_1.058790_2_plen_42_part_00
MLQAWCAEMSDAGGMCSGDTMVKAAADSHTISAALSHLLMW